ncbi:MAG: VOC family protein [Taibaiella sp.]|nr:VOC family protein [Taibaiella sp.]
MALGLLGLRTAVYFTDNIEKAKDWYSDILGIKPYFDEPFYVGFNVAGYELGLHPIDNNQANVAATNAAYWGVSDVQVAFDMLIAAGATSVEEPSDVGGGIVVATVRDPWGNPLGIICNPHFQLP